MAQNRIIFEVVAEGKNLKVVQRDADNLTQSVNNTNTAREKATKSQHTYNRQEKAIYQTNLASAKSFSKLTQSINGSGSSSLVNAYAILAANMFAATAAFNALKGAAEVANVQKALEFSGALIGQDIKQIAKELQIATGYGVSLAESYRSVAIATKAGLNTEEIMQLGVVAKGASIALGRDMTDSLSRLTKGVIKLEPEILDELGIIVRLEQATENYARSLNKNVKDLTTAERQQAFLNETLKQGLISYSGIAEAIDVSPFDKLSASLSDNANKLLNWINTSGGVNTAVEFLAGNVTALIGVLAVFASSVRGALLPSLFQVPKIMSDIAAQTRQQAAEHLKGTVAGTKYAKMLGDIPDQMKGGVLTSNTMYTTTGMLGKDLKSLQDEQKQLQKELEELDSRKQKALGITRVKQLEEKIRANDIEIEENRRVAASYEDTARQTRKAMQDNGKAASLMAAANLQPTKSWKEGAIAVRSYKENLMLANATMVGTKTALYGLALGIRAVGTALTAALGWIGVILAVGSALYELYQRFWPKSEMDKAQDRLDEAVDGWESTLESFQKEQEIFSQNRERLQNLATEGKITFTITDQTLQNLEFIQGQFSRIAQSIRDVAAAQKALDESSGRTAELEEERVNIQRQTAYYEKQLKDLQADPRANQPPPKKYLGFIQFEENIPQAIKNVQNKLAELRDQLAELDAPAKNKMLEQFQKDLSRLPRDTQLAMKGTMDQLAKSVFNSTNEEWLANVASFERRLTELNNAAKGVQEGMRNLEETATDAFKGMQTPYDNVLSALMAIKKEGAIGTSTIDNLFDPQELDKFKNAIKDKADLKQAGIPDFLRLPLNEAIALVQKLVENHKLATVEAEKYSVIMNTLNGIVAGYPDAAEKVLEISNSIHEAKVAELQLDVARTTELDKQLAERKLANEITTHTLSIKQLEIKKEEYLLSISEKDLELQKEKFKLSQQNLNAKLESEKAMGKEDPVSMERDLKSLYNLQRQVANETWKIEKNKLEIAQKSAVLQLEVLKFQAEQAGDTDLATRIGQVIDSVTKQHTEELNRLETAQKLSEELERQEHLTKNLARWTENLGKISLGNGLGKMPTEASLVANAGKQMQNATAARDAAKASLGLYKKAAEEAKKAQNDNPSVENALAMSRAEQQLKQAKAIADTTNYSIALAALDEYIATVGEKLKALGPDGEIAAMVGQGSIVIADRMGEAFKEGATTKQRVAAGIEAAAGAMSTIANISEIASQKKVAAIDAEIAAEQKRDGKSAASVARIQALEQKKEKAQRKAFEKNKKMRMAEVVMNTAAGMARAFADHAFPVSAIIAAIVGAMGVAQLAIISGTSYQGGGSLSSASGPSSISVGERQNKVDVSKKASGGELAYMQGQSGIGKTANDFKPAFIGARHRATGGYIVGEQGPELFTPEVPGVITPADKIKPSNPVNVTFQISAIDATNMQQMLDSQKGNIIDMIRQAANSHGQPFLESVDTMSLAPIRKGYGRLA